MKQYNNAKYTPLSEFRCSVASTLLQAKKNICKKRGRLLAASNDVRYDQHAPALPTAELM